MQPAVGTTLRLMGADGRPVVPQARSICCRGQLRTACIQQHVGTGRTKQAKQFKASRRHDCGMKTAFISSSVRVYYAFKGRSWNTYSFLQTLTNDWKLPSSYIHFYTLIRICIFSKFVFVCLFVCLFFCVFFFSFACLHFMCVSFNFHWQYCQWNLDKIH